MALAIAAPVVEGVTTLPVRLPPWCRVQFGARDDLCVRVLLDQRHDALVARVVRVHCEDNRRLAGCPGRAADISVGLSKER